ncbi:hypothetical protein C8F01DRAFT_192743 [Mycena amicta]|nr:hypothetical protein C8F01DRAFT_192743 [Mycena amicta]
MTEYDYSGEGRRRFMATQRRIANWVDQTESTPTLKSPFTPRSVTSSHHRGSHSAWPSSSKSKHPSSRSHSDSHSSSGTRTSRTSSHSSSRHTDSYTSTVSPSDSISQVSSHRPSHLHSHSHSSGTRFRHTSHGHPAPMLMANPPTPTYSYPTYTTAQQYVRPSADGRSYIISRAPSTQGMVIFPQPGRAPRVVFY